MTCVSTLDEELKINLKMANATLITLPKGFCFQHFATWPLVLLIPTRIQKKKHKCTKPNNYIQCISLLKGKYQGDFDLTWKR